MGMNIVWCISYIKKTTRRFKHCEEAWRVLVLRRYVKSHDSTKYSADFHIQNKLLLYFFIYINLLILHI